MDDLDDIDIDDEAGMEVQSLQSIFDTDLKVTKRKPWTFSVVVNPTTEEDNNHVSIRLNVTLFDGYPETVPEVVVQLEKGLNTSIRETLQALVKEKAEECVGMCMMFDITEAVKEYLQEHNVVVKSEYELMQERLEAQQQKDPTKEDLIAQAAKAKEDYVSSLPWVNKQLDSAVSKENFLAWKEKFDGENNQNTTLLFEVKKMSKLTGREIFEKDLKLGIDADAEEQGDEVFYFSKDLYDDDDLDDVDLSDDDDGQPEKTVKKPPAKKTASAKEKKGKKKDGTKKKKKKKTKS
mmetsp:Transcript_28652/g.39985  ORF Transcript_28652/g.39985 Transcript_28652/m.39985 type:complete len:293 (+) Transcript_28652:129-1007(+)|eukprot:CAMPEP_0185267386 /NCGR_PEP_ID=MMETSP1359-20130426/34258_1 /TAXON_ID=552665 /ORGANISM="Bigelowiella longifila, Strain CCMP242" /LENGTH=292 /DNA_ID=CAMNT_0027857725 /DNA_START=65 /DNA_END=943 /DNA_ORIENTATION=+